MKTRRRIGVSVAAVSLLLLDAVLIIKRGNEIVQTLHPRLQSAPEVLFARAPTLSPGQYKLLWQVKTLTAVGVVEGEIPFTVTSSD